MNERNERSGELKAADKLFHVRGPLTAKLRWPVEVRVRGPQELQTTRNAAVDDLV